MARYRKVDVRIWVDEKFRRLSRPQPCGQWLWAYLLTNPNTTNIPGLYRSGEFAMAEELEWPPHKFRAAFAEIVAQGMAEADWVSRVVFIPKAFHYDPPESPNVVASWRSTLDEIPECPLKTRAVAVLRQHLEAMGPAWVGAFDLASELPRDRRRPPDEPTRALVKARDGDLCRYCGHEVKWTDRRGPSGATLDHVDPTGPSTPENLVVACRSCSSFKGFRTVTMAGMQLRPESGPKSPPRSDLDSDLSPIYPKPGNPDPEPDPEQDPDPDPEGSAEASRPSPQPALALTPSEPPERPVMTFATIRGLKSNGSTWDLRPRDLELLREAFPGVDVLAECKQALLWTAANPTKQKTASGMLSFLNRWMSRAQNRGSNGQLKTVTAPFTKLSPWATRGPELTRYNPKVLPPK